MTNKHYKVYLNTFHISNNNELNTLNYYFFENQSITCAVDVEEWQIPLYLLIYHKIISPVCIEDLNKEDFNTLKLLCRVYNITWEVELNA